jgi:hypothetical protein
MPPLSVSVVELLRLDSWYFGLCPELGVSSSLSSTFFYFFAFAILCHDLLFALAYMRVLRVAEAYNKRVKENCFRSEILFEK